MVQTVKKPIHPPGAFTALLSKLQSFSYELLAGFSTWRNSSDQVPKKLKIQVRDKIPGELVIQLRDAVPWRSVPLTALFFQKRLNIGRILPQAIIIYFLLR